jgi:hypothetical protein
MYVFETDIKKISEDFSNVIKNQLLEYPDAVSILTALNEKSSVTFRHSVQVAFQFYHQMRQESFYTKEKIANWTLGALIHDAGKLLTSDRVLNSGKLSDPEFREMMEHSIRGYEILKDKDLPREAMAAAIGHHLKASCLDAGLDHAGASKPTWEESFGEGYVDALVKRELSWMSKEDIYALKILSFNDCCEAERCDYRSYKDAFSWGSKEEKGTVLSCMDFDVAKGVLDETVAKRAFSARFRILFDALQSTKVTEKTRFILMEQEMSKGRDTFELSR